MGLCRMAFPEWWSPCVHPQYVAFFNMNVTFCYVKYRMAVLGRAELCLPSLHEPTHAKHPACARLCSRIYDVSNPSSLLLRDFQVQLRLTELIWSPDVWQWSGLFALIGFLDKLRSCFPGSNLGSNALGKHSIFICLNTESK